MLLCLSCDRIGEAVLLSLYLQRLNFELVPKGDTSSFTVKIIKIARKLAESANSRRFCPRLNFSLCSLILDILSGALS